MSAQIDATKNKTDKYASMVLHYSHNAEKYLKLKDYNKASEMMWGAMSCVLKTAAAKRNKSINSHKTLGQFAKTLSKQEQDKEIFISFSYGNVLHRNFYESNLDTVLVKSMCFDVAKTIGKLMRNMKYRAP
ncbi:MAG: PaREP1 family protein [Candidatus Nitrosoabyssus spongiisocia]|nr:MAG: PaREP1 family protein [Nitrosopumilaceae archaeon AB1(1)]